MSRASAGYADFFPTAPSVLQQKHKQATLDRQRARKKAVDTQSVAPRTDLETTPAPPPPPPPPPSSDSAHGHGLVNGGVVGTGPAQDDIESALGDLLNGVGSASSHTSTVSSVFSGVNNPLVGSNPGALSSAHALTPLTNTESSPAERATSPPLPKSAYHDRILDRQPAASPSLVKALNDAPPENAQIMTPPDIPGQARPSGRQVKGFWCTYDPELDKKLSSRERKKLKPVYKELGLEVCSYSLVL